MHIVPPLSLSHTLTYTHIWTYRPCTNRLAVFLSMPWRSQVTCPWLCLSVFFRTNTQLSSRGTGLFSAVTLGKTEGRTPISLEMVRTALPRSSHTMMVHWLFEVLQVNRASSPRRTVSVSGDSFIWAPTAKRRMTHYGVLKQFPK